ncbi:hypothetical protein BWQ96_08476 [Gracilariopsis chorda]|uniref:Retrovirus-related Pol polyprotein from transposon TNT 1-94-like beta-barrel domain-containing protein n=1 Tax=Gracilariopsis chorda TaxID=448386 RepID=A0A2V3IIB3_9FLOR|nr:hypothetical protein BWQ96_08476 [Gracilariopsis chorda]|eukprot:PXF41799.1 hypothetical protein BWQ96_08476 [Gracilariopsis chorda]
MSGTKSQNDSRCFFCKKKGHKMRTCWHNLEIKNYKVEKKRCDKDHENTGNGDDDDVVACLNVVLLGNEKTNEDEEIDLPCEPQHMKHKLSDEKHVSVGDGSTIQVNGQGEVECWAIDGEGQIVRIHLYDVMYVPQLMRNLLSVSAIRRRGFMTSFLSEDGENGIAVVLT